MKIKITHPSRYKVLFLVFMVVAMVISDHTTPSESDFIFPYLEEAGKTAAIALGCQYSYTALFAIFEGVGYVFKNYYDLWFGDDLAKQYSANLFKYTIIPVRIFCVGAHFGFLFIQLWVLGIVRHQANRKLTGKEKKIAYFLAWPIATLFTGAAHTYYNEVLVYYVSGFFSIH